MPARRLPWFKLWPESMRHEKIALLSDGAFRTWVMVLAAGSEQAERWRFASVKHAASVTGRPVKHIKELIVSRLLDESANGELWVHNWRKWQDRYESDIAPRTLRDDSAKAPHSLKEEERGEKREEEGEKDIDLELSQLFVGGAGGNDHGAIAPPKPKQARAKASKPRTPPPDTLEPNEADYAAGARAGLTREQVDAKVGPMLDYHRKEVKTSGDWHASLRTWLGNAPKYDQPRSAPSQRSGHYRPPLSGIASRIPTDASEFLMGRNGPIPRR